MSRLFGGRILPYVHHYTGLGSDFRRFGLKCPVLTELFSAPMRVAACEVIAKLRYNYEYSEIKESCYGRRATRKPVCRNHRFSCGEYEIARRGRQTLPASRHSRPG